MKKLIALLMLTSMMVACNLLPDQEKETQKVTEKVEIVKDGVFIHISKGYDNPQKVLMAMKMAVLMASDKDVLIYMDIDAVKLALSKAEDLTFNGFESFRTYLKELIEKKVGIYVCPTCLDVAGFTAADLIEGVKMAEKDKFFNFTKGRILAFDY